MTCWPSLMPSQAKKALVFSFGTSAEIKMENLSWTLIQINMTSWYQTLTQKKK
uniref:Alternative protein MORC4 n=1 Tax=Homo sapiens TaxID=9606 RepID=L8E741_HUMAN|nr:alternative protein MORC4 [Homo sapiens]